MSVKAHLANCRVCGRPLTLRAPLDATLARGLFVCRPCAHTEAGRLGRLADLVQTHLDSLPAPAAADRRAAA